MARNHMGRHRAPGFNPLNELGDIAARSAQPAMKASAVAVASGGLVAAFALPASAAPAADTNNTAAAAASPLTAPVAATETLAVAAPAATDAVPAYGVVGFTAKAAPEPAAPVVQIKRITPAAVPRASRSTARPTVAARTATVQPDAPAVDAPAPTGGVLDIAASLSGIPYRWGGTTPAGFDCSGYTGYVFAQAGKSLPRTAEAQRQAAATVSNPVPGDLVFVGFPAFHVGIYAGGGQMYDSQRPGTLSGLHVIWTQKNVSYGRF